LKVLEIISKIVSNFFCIFKGKERETTAKCLYIKKRSAEIIKEMKDEDDRSVKKMRAAIINLKTECEKSKLEILEARKKKLENDPDYNIKRKRNLIDNEIEQMKSKLLNLLKQRDLIFMQTLFF